MAILNLDALDDAVIEDACPGFVGGQQSFGPPDQLQQTQAAELVNIDISDATATTRRGAESLGAASDTDGAIQGLFWFDTPTRELIFAVADGTQWVYEGDAWAAADDPWAMGTATGPICLAQLVETLFLADGIGNLFAWDGTTHTDLGNTPGAPGDPPEGASIVISATGRLWLSGIASAPDTIWASYYLEYDKWHADFGNIRVGQGEGDPITGLCEIDDSQLAVFKRNSIYVLRAAPATITTVDSAGSLTNANLEKISDTIGCVSHRSIASVGKDILFLSDGGVYSVGRILAQKDRELDNVPLSVPVQDIIDRINWEHASKAAGWFWDNRYFLSLPLDDNTTPSTLLVYNTLRQAWSGIWTGWDASCWALTKPAGSERLTFGRSDGSVWRWLDYVSADNVVDSDYTDNGAGYSSSVRTRAMIMGNAISPKSPLSVQVEFFNSEATAQVAVLEDEQEPLTLRDEVQTNVGELLLPFTLPAILPSRGLKRRAFGMQHLPPFRSLQCEVSANFGKLALRAVILTGFANTTRLEE